MCNEKELGERLPSFFFDRGENKKNISRGAVGVYMYIFQTLTQALKPPTE